MHGHKILTERTGVQIYFADPHRPWQRGSNENTDIVHGSEARTRSVFPNGRDGTESAAELVLLRAVLPYLARRRCRLSSCAAVARRRSAKLLERICGA